MINYYVKQAWELMRQNKLFTGIYVVGTALAVASTMIMAIIYYVKLAPLYPETNRANTYYMIQGRFNNKTNGWSNSWSFSYKALQDWFYPLQSAKVVSAYYDNSRGETYYVQPFDESGDFQVNVKFVDPAFFQIYNYKFIDGKSFSQAEFDSGQRNVVISDNLAKQLFKTTDNVVGKTFSLNYVEYRLSGVVREPSFLMSQTYVQVLIPYTCISGYEESQNQPDYMGQFKVAILAKDGKALRAEIEELVRKYEQVQNEWRWVIYNQPMSYYTTVFAPYPEEDSAMGPLLLTCLGVLIALLLVPALNLSSMIAGRMETRLAEMGVRKAFGANCKLLLGQVMWENLILTLVGGCLGLLIAWMALYGFRSSLFSLLDQDTYDMTVISSTQVDAGMLFAPAIFGIALLVCLLLNMLSALIPAWNSLRHPIVESLNEKR